MAESLSTESLVWTSAPDPRTAGWFLVGKENFWRLLGLMAVYVVGVKVVGPWMMRNRKPYEIRNVVLMYNLFMILASAFFLGEFVRMAYFENKYTLFLQELDMSDRPATLRLVSLSWWYYMLRIFEFTEAVFFVLRKKYGQASGLHLSHHCAVAVDIWFVMTYGAQAQSMFVTCINTFVHLVMYSYYFLSALGPWMQQFLWWKRYLTQFQLVQFVVIMVDNALPLFSNGRFLRDFSFLLLSEGLLYFCWFMIFYMQNYRKQKMSLPSESRKTD